jgi:hypothetical protein
VRSRIADSGSIARAAEPDDFDAFSVSNVSRNLGYLEAHVNLLHRSTSA